MDQQLIVDGPVRGSALEPHLSLLVLLGAAAGGIVAALLQVDGEREGSAVRNGGGAAGEAEILAVAVGHVLVFGLGRGGSPPRAGSDAFVEEEGERVRVIGHDAGGHGLLEVDPVALKLDSAVPDRALGHGHEALVLENSRLARRRDESTVVATVTGGMDGGSDDGGDGDGEDEERDDFQHFFFSS